MKCPVCPETDLVMTERQGVEIDYCPKCRGVWLDRGELDKIVERSAVTPAPAPASGPGHIQQDARHRQHDHHSHLPPQVDWAVRSFIRRHKRGLRLGCLAALRLRLKQAVPGGGEFKSYAVEFEAIQHQLRRESPLLEEAIPNPRTQ